MTLKQGFDLERLARIEPFLQREYLDNGRLPCAQVLVQRRGEAVWRTTLGSMDLERKRPLAEDTIFRIYSMTKPLTSVAAMMLVERGLLMLDDPVARYIPAFAGLGVYAGGVPGAWRTTPCKRPMLIVDLLRHTAGLTYGFQNRTNVDAAYRSLRIGEGGEKATLEGLVELLAQVPLEFSPGDAWNYSLATDVLGYVIQVVAGKPFDEFLHAELTGPLGMHDTAFHVPQAKASRFAACYAATPTGGMVLVDDPTKSPALAPATLPSGGGGLMSTTADYARFCQMLVNRGELDGRRYLGPRSLQLMWTNHLPGGVDLPRVSVSMFAESAFAGMGFGLGFSVLDQPHLGLIPASPGEAAWGGMASTAFWVDPSQDLFVIFMTQLMPSSTWPVRRQLRTMVYSALID